MSLESLYKRIRHEDICLWVGAGFSTYAGYPNGTELKRAIIAELPVAERQRLSEALPLDDVAEGFVNQKNGSRHELIEILRKNFLRTPDQSPAHQILCRIPHFHSIITTNYDSALEHNYFDRCSVLRTSSDIPYAKNTGAKIFKIHGDFTDPLKIVITKNDYSKFYNLNHDYRDPFWAAITHEISTKAVLFLGYGYDDPNIWALFESLDKHVGNNRKERFLISRAADPARAAYLNRCSIEHIEMSADAFLNELQIRLKETVANDLEDGIVSYATYQAFLAFNDMKSTVSSVNGRTRIDSIEKVSGATNARLKLSIDDKWTIERLMQFNKGIGKSIEIEARHISHFSHEFEGFKVDRLHNLAKIMVQRAPGVFYYSLAFVEDHLEINDVKVNWYRIGENKHELTFTLHTFRVKVELETAENNRLNVNIGIESPKVFPPVRQALELYRCLYKFLNGDSFRLYRQGEPKPIDAQIPFQSNSEYFKQYIPLFEALQKIERKFGVRFASFESISSEDVQRAHQLAFLIDNKYLRGDPEQDKLLTHLIVEPGSPFMEKIGLLGVQGSALAIDFTDDFQAEFLGQTLQLGKRTILVEDCVTTVSELGTRLTSSSNTYLDFFSEIGYPEELSRQS